MTEFSSNLITGDDDPFLPKLIDEINKAKSIDIAVAFIRESGLRLLFDALLDAIVKDSEEEKGSKVRIITGDYLGVTEPKALRKLMLLKDEGAEIKVFESKGQSFHMKAYIFIHGQDMESGSAYIGSSNITHSALGSGLEWNLRVTKKENPSRFIEIQSKFNDLITHQRAIELNHHWIDDYERYLDKNSQLVVRDIFDGNQSTLDVDKSVFEPNKIQAEALQKLSEARLDGVKSGLVVLATGMGKTWLSAFDAKQSDAKKVLFVAHREEILFQAENTFLTLNPECKVGRFIGSTQDLDADYLFASIQTLGKKMHLEKFNPNHFDYVVVDEFHHAAARTYQKLLSYFSPKFLLGLTATPERTDQADILSLCDNNLIFEKGLFEGVISKILSPFNYFGIGDDEVDYSEIPWRNGKFDSDALLNQLATQARANHVYKNWVKLKQKQTLGFCISQKHADFMAEFFNKKGVKAVSVHSQSEIRRSVAINALVNGEVEVLFSVDLFNEGVDIPSLDTVLMLRPTESKIIFLQQMGRGLRLSQETGKEKLIVVDFIGNHISFFKKAEALFKIDISNRARKEFIELLKNDNLSLPEGCFVNYDLSAIDIMEKLVPEPKETPTEIYNNLKSSLGRRPTLVEFYRGGGSVSKVKQEYGQWLELVFLENDLLENEKLVYQKFKSFFLEVEKSQMTKSFKMVLLDALLGLDGFLNAPLVEDLGFKSLEILKRNKVLINDIPDIYRNDSLPERERKSWIRYWVSNPIYAWVGGDSGSLRSFFSVEDENFIFNLIVNESECESFEILLKEIVNYRLMHYENRDSVQGVVFSAADENLQRNDIPFFSDLKIACGHFKESDHLTENIEYRSLPLKYGILDPSRHFIARAKGNSMNGGRNPIIDGDYLLLEKITSSSAGSLHNQVVAIERDGVAGDDQYLLREVKKVKDSEYLLLAHNPDYEVIESNEEMRTFARLKAIIDPVDFLIHREFYKHEVAEQFGLEYKEGVWKMPGHVKPQDSNDQFLFVTLIKQGVDNDHRYDDYFLDANTFHWQSQNSTTPDSDRGLGIINHKKEGSDLHLFVRRRNKIKGKGAPFTYCGRINYLTHDGSAPMNITCQLEVPLTDELLRSWSFN